MRKGNVRFQTIVALSCLAGVAGALASPPPGALPDRIEPHEPPHERGGDPYLPPPPRPAPSPEGPQSVVRRGPFVSVQVNVDAFGHNIPGDAANEPSIAVDPTNPQRIVIGWRQFDNIGSNFRQSGYGYSQDGGRTWTFPGSLWPGIFGSDPVLAADANGAFYYMAIGFDFPGVRLFRSFDGGVTWGGPLTVSASFRDKEWMTIDRTAGTGRGHIYGTWTSSVFVRSTDGGLTWGGTAAPVSMWGTLDVGPDGEVYLVDRDFTVALSFDARDPARTPTFPRVSSVNLGGPFVTFGAPNPGGLVGQPWIATDHSPGPTRGNAYVFCSVDPPGSDPLDVTIARSTDGGQTWDAPVRVNDDLPSTLAWQWFGTMSVAPNGRIDVIWCDTRNSELANVSELFYSYSNDTGQAWSSNVPVSPSFNSYVGWPQQNKIGDYYHMISDEAAANLAYAATFNGEQDVYFIRIGDCNENGIHDGTDITAGTSLDCNNNTIPDGCEYEPGIGCPPDILLGDLNCDGRADGLDIDPFTRRVLTGGYTCQADVNQDGALDVSDVPAFVTVLLVS